MSDVRTAQGSPVLLVCGNCGSKLIQRTTWYWINSGRHCDSEPPFDYDWCVDCDTECDVVSEETYKKLDR